MTRVIFVPGAITAGANITIPTDAPDIDAVVSAEITRIESALAVAADTSGTTELAEILAGKLGVGAGGTLTGANPVVAAVPTKSTTRIITLDVNTVLGDLLTLSYLAVGQRVLVS